MRLPALVVPLAIGLGACENPPNVFTVQDDIQLGQNLKDEINNKPKEFPVVDRADAPAAYAELDRMFDSVLNSGRLRFANDFPWEIHLIDDDKTLNAFAAPGGQIWVYSGLMRFLETEDHFVGVLGHEVAHADRRHSTRQLTKAVGLSVLLDIVFGEDEPGLAADVAAALLTLEFSRQDEADADQWSVAYLCETPYAANGAAGFFEKLLTKSTYQIPEFLSSHPSSESRVQDINMMADDLGCSTKEDADADWAAVLATLP